MRVRHISDRVEARRAETPAQQGQLHSLACPCDSPSRISVGLGGMVKVCCTAGQGNSTTHVQSPGYVWGAAKCGCTRQAHACLASVHPQMDRQPGRPALLRSRHRMQSFCRGHVVSDSRVRVSDTSSRVKSNQVDEAKIIGST